MKPMCKVIASTWLVTLAMIATACADGSDADKGGNADGILKVGWENYSSLDPIQGSSGTDGTILLTMFDTLVVQDKKTGEPMPGLAESWSQTATTVDFVLHDGILFQDGTPLDAEAVKFNIERAKSDLSVVATDLESIDSVEVVDDLTVRFHLNRPDSSLVLVLSDRAGMMVSPTAAKAGDDAISQHPVGAGPFTFVSAKSGVEVVVDRFDDYWQDGLPKLDSVEFRLMAEGPTQVNAVLTGEVDVITRPPFQDLKTMKDSPGLTVLEPMTTVYDCIYINGSIAPFDDDRVRRAFNFAIDREAYLDTIYLGLGEIAWTNFPSNHWAYDESLVPTYSHSVEKAKELLAEAGVPNGFRAQMLVSNNAIVTRKAEVIKAQLAQVGIDIEIVPMDRSEEAVSFSKGMAPLDLSGWSGRPDPAQSLKQLFGENAFFNAGHVVVPGLTQALDAANTSTDVEERKAHLSEAQIALTEAAVNAPLAYAPFVTVLNSKIEGFETALSSKLNFANVTIED